MEILQNNRMPRKQFLKYTGVGLAGAAFFTLDSCKKDTNTSSVSLGSGDTGILNLAYMLEQIEAAFYTKVISSFYAGATTDERALFNDFQKHEVCHRDFYKAVLGNSAIKDLTFDFSSIDFTNRTSVITAARTFEDTGIGTYNGAGQLLTSADNLLLAGKIVSMEARHAAILRDLLNPNSANFSGDDIVNADGLDTVRDPASAVAAARPFITSTVDYSQLPTS